MRLKTILKVTLLGLIITCTYSCANDINVSMPKGPKGDPGKSAFELWKEIYGKGEETTIQDFFNALKGEKGEQGEQGERGLDAYEQWKEGISNNQVYDKQGDLYSGGETIEEYFEWLKGVKGDKGEQGNVGKDGLNAYELWTENVERGHVLNKEGKPYEGGTTLEDYFAWLVGKTGANGENGKDGLDGEDGKEGLSAYEEWKILVQKGEIKDKTGAIYSKGTNLLDFMEWLKGENGQKGVPGEQGLSAYQEWLTLIEKGEIKDRDGGSYTGGLELLDFMEWLKGRDGADGEKGEQGVDGTDGLDGKSSYALWKEAVNEGTMTNKDGTPYTDGDSWEAYLKWLQGGDVSILYHYWNKLPGNNDKTLDDFIKAIFDCHCDQVEVVVTPYSNCILVDRVGKIEGTYSAEVRLMANAGTKVTVKDEEGKLLIDQEMSNDDILFKIDQKETEQQLTITYTAPKKSTSKEKHFMIPALRPIKTVIDKTEEETAVRVKFIFSNFKAIESVMVDGLKIVNGKNGWTQNADGFEKEYKKSEKDQEFNVQIKAKDRDCTELIYKIPSLQKIEKPTISYKLFDACSYKTIIKGEPGLTIIAKSKHTDPKEKVAKETSPGTYEIMFDKEFFYAAIYLEIKKMGYGTISEVLQPTHEMYHQKTVQRKLILNETYGSTYRIRYTNSGAYPVKIKFSRTNNWSGSALQRDPWIQNRQTEYTIPANGAVEISFQKDYTTSFKDGGYNVTAKIVNVCHKEDKERFAVPNQSNYKYGFSPIEDETGGETGSTGGGTGEGGVVVGPGSGVELEPGENWNPDGSITTLDGHKVWRFLFEVEDALPGKFLQLLLNHHGDLLKAVFNRQVDQQGTTSGVITLEDADFKAALESGIGQIIFANDKQARDVIHTSDIKFEIKQ